MKSFQLILVLILFAASSVLIMHSGKTAPKGDQQKQDEVQSMTSIIRITRGPNAIQEKDNGGLESQEHSNEREPINRGVVQHTIHNSRILHFPLQPMDLTVSPAEAALHSATIAAIK